MKPFLIITTASLATSTGAQIGICPGFDLCIAAIPDSVTPGEWTLVAEFSGGLPGAATAIGAIWSDVSFSLRGDAPITITDWNDGFGSPIFGDPSITGNGSNEVAFVGLQPAAPLGTPDPSNPLEVVEFIYNGSINALRGELVGQNSALFTGDPAEPFGSIVLYQDSRGNPGELTAGFAVPTPATLALAPFALVATRRRRR